MLMIWPNGNINIDIIHFGKCLEVAFTSQNLNTQFNVNDKTKFEQKHRYYLFW